MLAATYPLQIILMTFSGLVNRHQVDVIAYLVEENRGASHTLAGLGEFRAPTQLHQSGIGAACSSRLCFTMSRTGGTCRSSS